MASAGALKLPEAYFEKNELSVFPQYGEMSKLLLAVIAHTLHMREEKPEIYSE